MSRCTSATWRLIDIDSATARTQDDGVVFFDLAGYDVEGYNKFIPYYLFPDFDLHGVGEPVEFPDQDLGGVESLDAGGAEAQSGDHLRALRRRRTRAGGSDQPGARASWNRRGRSRRRLWRS